MSVLRIAAALIAFMAVSVYVSEHEWSVHGLAAPVGPAAADPVQVVAGEVPPIDAIYFIEEPGIYGLGREIPGSRYAIISNILVRLDSKTNKVLSILRTNIAVQN
ncbi:hypothetical protein H4P12_16295 [Paracoccus sp. 11-3]|uniref:Nickel/cobalt transporter regulator n=1 Tax=Paracoccus amoyensis TaxID=2760093 RepID=A0A926GFG2_9RHOB|nr:hypothetical protein [Paracoccus amoyensis]MBC9248235.1 hypothetical protein [Paracoccus amoyensis]